MEADVAELFRFRRFMSESAARFRVLRSVGRGWRSRLRSMMRNALIAAAVLIATCRAIANAALCEYANAERIEMQPPDTYVEVTAC